jgi:hypothetical protein
VGCGGGSPGWVDSQGWAGDVPPVAARWVPAVGPGQVAALTGRDVAWGWVVRCAVPGRRFAPAVGAAPVPPARLVGPHGGVFGVRSGVSGVAVSVGRWVWAGSVAATPPVAPRPDAGVTPPGVRWRRPGEPRALCTAAGYARHGPWAGGWRARCGAVSAGLAHPSVGGWVRGCVGCAGSRGAADCSPSVGVCGGSGSPSVGYSAAAPSAASSKAGPWGCSPSSPGGGARSAPEVPHPTLLWPTQLHPTLLWNHHPLSSHPHRIPCSRQHQRQQGVPS